MDNGAPLTARIISYFHTTTDLYDVAAVRVRLYADVRESELETGYVLVWAFNYLILEGGLESVLEGISDVRNVGDEVVSGSNGNNQT